MTDRLRRAAQRRRAFGDAVSEAAERLRAEREREARSSAQQGQRRVPADRREA